MTRTSGFPGETSEYRRARDKPGEIAHPVAFVASPAASYVNGAALQVGGGAPAIRLAA